MQSVVEVSLEQNTKYKVLVNYACENIQDVNMQLLCEKFDNSITSNATHEQCLQLLVSIASSLIGEDPNYSKVASRLLSYLITEELHTLNIYTFTDSIEHGHQVGLISDKTVAFAYKHKLDTAIVPSNTDLFEYFGLKTVYDRYLLRDPKTRKIIESPQDFLLRVSIGLCNTRDEVVELYNVMSKLEYLPSSPTLFNAGTTHTQMSSCFLLDSPADDLEAIYKSYSDIARLSKFSGGIGIPFSKLRSTGSAIRGTNGQSHGIIPFLKTLDSSVAAVSQGSKRKGACCAYLETWHADIEQFLELRNNTGDPARRTYNLNLANWVPDLFMKRVIENKVWSLFDPRIVPHFPDLYGKEFEDAYVEAEDKKLYVKQVPARELYALMMKTLAETGNGWMTFKDASNNKSNQTGKSGKTIHSSNLCTEILEVTSDDQTAVCNLGSINLSKFVRGTSFDFAKLSATVRTVVPSLDRVIDRNLYRIPEAKQSNNLWRPIGLGLMGLQDVFFKLHLPFDSKEALQLSTDIQECIYYNALYASCDLAKKLGSHQTFYETRASDGVLQFDLWNVVPSNTYDWGWLKEEIQQHGLRNSLLIAIAPTATIASIAGCSECIEPLLSNLFKRETLSGEFVQINASLVQDLKLELLWNEEVKNAIVASEGSIQNIEGIPQKLKDIYKTSWEISQKVLVKMAAARGAFIDQSQSLNLFMETPTVAKLSSLFKFCFENGIKSTYYLRSRAALKNKKITINNNQAVACSIDDPLCEACM